MLEILQNDGGREFLKSIGMGLLIGLGMLFVGPVLALSWLGTKLIELADALASSCVRAPEPLAEDDNAPALLQYEIAVSYDWQIKFQPQKWHAWNRAEADRIIKDLFEGMSGTTALRAQKICVRNATGGDALVRTSRHDAGCVDVGRHFARMYRNKQKTSWPTRLPKFYDTAMRLHARRRQRSVNAIVAGIDGVIAKYESGAPSGQPGPGSFRKLGSSFDEKLLQLSGGAK